MLNLALKWTPTEIFMDLPVSLAGKLILGAADLNFSQTVSNVPIDYEYKNGEVAFLALVSKNLVIFEPYFGIGTVSARGTLSANTAIFVPGFTTDLSATTTKTGTVWMVGTEIKLLALKLGAEYTNMFGTSRAMGKLSFFF
jgi:hypothetical protein